LSHLDFPNLYNLPGGFKAWAKAGKPVEKITLLPMLIFALVLAGMRGPQSG